MVPPAGWVATRPATVMTDYDNLPCFAPVTVGPAQGLSYLVGNKRATVAAAGMSDEPTTEDDATDDPAAEAELAQLLAEEVQTQAEEAETPTAEDAPTSEEAYSPHPLFLPLIRLASADDGAAAADTQLAGDEATEAYLSSESDAETAAIVIVSELTDAALIGEEASSTPPAEAAEEEAVETEALARRLFLPVVRR
jgi:hypothetical protein